MESGYRFAQEWGMLRNARTEGPEGVISVSNNFRHTNVYSFFLEPTKKTPQQRLSYAIINAWYPQTFVTEFIFSCEACKCKSTRYEKNTAAPHAITMGGCCILDACCQKTKAQKLRFA